jgi:hypothetical protein
METVVAARPVGTVGAVVSVAGEAGPDDEECVHATQSRSKLMAPEAALSMKTSACHKTSPEGRKKPSH